MPTRPLETHGIALRADATDDNRVHVGAVDGEERFDLVAVSALREQVAYTTQVATAFLADVPYDEDIVARANLGGVHRAKKSEQHGKAARIVADPRRVEFSAFPPHGDVGALGKDRIEMRCDGDQRAIADPPPDAHDIPDRILLDVIKAVRTQHVEVGGGTHVLLEWRGWDLGQRDDIGDGPLVLGIECLDSPFEGRVTEDFRDFLGVIALHKSSFQRTSQPPR